MISVKVDPHVHTISSGHAFSTIEENALHAGEQGLEAIAMTDHFGFGFGWGAPLSFGASMNMKALPQIIHGVRVLAGAEIDIIDFEGNLAGCNTTRFLSDDPMLNRLLDSREIAIASVHFFKGCRDGTVAENTRMYCNVAANPKINIIGHPGRSGITFDIDEVLQTAKQSGCLIEINEHSFDSGEPVISVCRTIAVRCAELDVPIAVGSDAHSAFFVGKFTRALAMLEEIGFPEALIANTTLERLLGFVARKSK